MTIRQTACAETPITTALATFATDTDGQEIPAAVRGRAVHHILDAVGIAYASTRHDFAHRTLTAFRGLGDAGSSVVIGMPGRLSPRDAAVVNGLLCHGLDFDDTHSGGVIHPTASVFPAVFAAASVAGATGQELVSAYIIGVEAAARLGAVAKGGFHQVGFHPTSLIGVFACTLAIGRILGLTVAQLEMAQGIALSLASGSLEFLEDGAWNKRLHPGWAAHAGLTAAALAREGFVGVSHPYDGRFGLYRSYLGPAFENCDLGAATAGLGETWEMLNTAIKPFPACHFTHASIDAALLLVESIGEPSRIRSINAIVPGEVVKTVCEPEVNKKIPSNSYDAKFSLPFLIAAALHRRRLTLAELEPDTINDPDILATAAKVSYSIDPNSPFPHAYSGELRIVLEDGSELTHREELNRGSAGRPLSNEEIIEKYIGNASLAVNRVKAERIKSVILDLDNTPNAVSALEILAPHTA
jgi:2-methylcitrate dehydratase PrpD